MSAITTHVLDIAGGQPARGVPIKLEIEIDGVWQEIGRGQTDADGRLRDLLSSDSDFREGTYRLTFDTADYFVAQKTESFYPAVTVTFIVHDAAQHYHVPLLLSPFGYSTYRGS